MRNFFLLICVFTFFYCSNKSCENLAGNFYSCDRENELLKSCITFRKECIIIFDKLENSEFRKGYLCLETLNQNSTFYYILDTFKINNSYGISKTDGIIGPLNKTSFLEQLKKL